MAPQSTNSQIRLAKDDHQMDFLGNLAAILANPNQRVVSIMLIDRSQSMSGYELPVLRAVNNHLEDIQNPPDGSDQYAMVVTFNDGYRVAIPLADANSISEMTSYRPKGMTRLFETVYLTLKLFVKAYERLNDAQRQNLKIAFGIFTDGDDNKSDKTKFPRKLIVLVNQARAMGFEFFTYGFRFDAARIAAIMGLPTDSDHAISFDKSPEGFEAAQRHYSASTTSFFAGANFRPDKSQTS